MEARLERARTEATRRLKDALPSAALYTVLFASIIAIFGTSFTMVISPLIVVFRSRRSKPLSLAQLPRIWIVLLGLNLLSYLATVNLVLCVLLNAAVPFALVIIMTNQFAPKAYFGYVMLFAFLELRPVTPEDLLLQLACTAFSAGIAVCALAIAQWWNGRGTDRERELSEGLEQLADLLDRLGEGEPAANLTADLSKLERRFDRLCYTKQHLFRAPGADAIRDYMYATLFQRAIYLISDSAWQQGKEERVDVSALHDIAALLRQVRRADTPEKRAVIRRCLLMLLDMVELPEGRLRVFFRSFLHMLMLIVSDAHERRGHLRYRFASPNDIMDSLRRHLDPDAFECRFATRLAVVMTVSSAINMVWGFNHLYWLPLNAFLLLMPSYEESAHRMRTRPLGTAIGCVATFAVSHVITGPLGVYAFSMVMILLLYACTPGSWIQAVFATSFALMMASLTMEETTAMALRLLFVVAATGLVLVVNRFVLPSSRDRIYEGNKRQLFGINVEYWDFVRRSINLHVPLHRSGELLAAFHLVYEEAYTYTQDIDDEALRAAEQRRLVTLWHMFSEVEQVEYLVQSGELGEIDQALLHRIALRLRQRPTTVTPHGPVQELIEAVRSKDLRYALDHYVENGTSLVQ